MARRKQSRVPSDQPAAGELRFPVSLARSKRTPDNEAGFDRTLNHYLDTFAKVEEKTRRVLNGQDVENMDFHIFTIRRPEDVEPEERDYLAFDGAFYRMHRIKPVGTARQFLKLECTVEGDADSFEYVESEVEPSVGEPSGSDNPLPLWR